MVGTHIRVGQDDYHAVFAPPAPCLVYALHEALVLCSSLNFVYHNGDLTVFGIILREADAVLVAIIVASKVCYDYVIQG
jgi:hypothetical protein